MAEHPRALEGIRVIDFSWIAVGPTSVKYLTNQGAEVIRLESTSHLDISRRIPPWKNDIVDINNCGVYINYNEDKYGITLNLRQPKGQELALRLISAADVVVENFTAGVMKRLGLDYDSLRQVRPDLVMCSLGLQGGTGPEASLPGVGITGQALAGVTHLTGWPDREPVATNVPYSDYTAPPFAALAIIGALEYRRRTGKGQHIDISQSECAMHCLETAVLDYTANGREQSRQGNYVPYAAPHGVYPCRGTERWVAIAVFTDEEWDGLCRTMGNPPWTAEPRFATMLGRLRHVADLDRLIGEWTRPYMAEQLVAMLQAAGVPSGLVASAEDLHSDPQLKHRQHFWELYQSVIGWHTVDGPAFRLSKTPAELKRGAPLQGEHNETVYREFLGLSEDEYVQLMVDGALE